jgi:hypothetical protein
MGLTGSVLNVKFKSFFYMIVYFIYFTLYQCNDNDTNIKESALWR